MRWPWPNRCLEKEDEALWYNFLLSRLSKTVEREGQKVWGWGGSFAKHLIFPPAAANSLLHPLRWECRHADSECAEKLTEKMKYLGKNNTTSQPKELKRWHVWKNSFVYIHSENKPKTNCIRRLSMKLYCGFSMKGRKIYSACIFTLLDNGNIKSILSEELSHTLECPRRACMWFMVRMTNISSTVASFSCKNSGYLIYFNRNHGSTSCKFCQELFELW